MFLNKIRIMERIECFPSPFTSNGNVSSPRPCIFSDHCITSINMKRSYSPSPPSSPVFSKARRSSNHLTKSSHKLDQDSWGDIVGQLTPQSTASSECSSVPCGQRQPSEQGSGNDDGSEGGGRSGFISSLSKSDNNVGGDPCPTQVSWLQSEGFDLEDDLLEVPENETRIDELELLTQAVNDSINHSVIAKPSDEVVEFKSALDLLNSSPPLLSVGCPLLDQALAGGLRRGALTEVVGESSAGKTQFCLQCALTTASKGEKVVYIVTEGSFPQARLDQMVQARGREDLRDLILVQQVKDVHHLLAVLGDQLDKVISSVGLVIVDSIAALVRYDGDLTSGLLRGGMVHRLGQAVLGVALKHKVAVLAVNQVTGFMEGSRVSCFTWGRKVVASLGLAWTQYPHTRLWLTKTRLVISKTASAVLSGLVAETRLRTMHVDWSCRLENSTTHFIVDPKGCRGIRVVDDDNDIDQT